MTFIPVMHQPCIKGIEEYMYESDRMYAKEKDHEKYAEKAVKHLDTGEGITACPGAISSRVRKRWQLGPLRSESRPRASCTSARTQHRAPSSREASRAQ